MKRITATTVTLAETTLILENRNGLNKKQIIHTSNNYFCSTNTKDLNNSFVMMGFAIGKLSFIEIWICFTKVRDIIKKG